MKHSVVMSISLLAWCFVATIASAQTIFVINTSPELTPSGTVDPQSFSWAVDVPDHAPPPEGLPSAALGVPDLVSGAPASSPEVVDFNGYSTFEFDVPVGDGDGVDILVVGVQLDTVEGWDLYVGTTADSGTMVFVGTFDGSPAGQLNPITPLTVAVDFNGTPVPHGARFLRFEPESTGPPTYAFDFDAIGVIPAPEDVDSFSVPTLPPGAWLVLLALIVFIALQAKRSWRSTTN